MALACADRVAAVAPLGVALVATPNAGRHRPRPSETSSHRTLAPPHSGLPAPVACGAPHPAAPSPATPARRRRCPVGVAGLTLAAARGAGHVARRQSWAAAAAAAAATVVVAMSPTPVRLVENARSPMPARTRRRLVRQSRVVVVTVAVAMRHPMRPKLRQRTGPTLSTGWRWRVLSADWWMGPWATSS